MNSKVNILRDIDLKDQTTFHVGGRAEYYSEVDTIEKLKEVLDFAKENNLQITILGGGSNLLLDDSGINGLVIKYSNSEIKFVDKNEETLVEVGAGRTWDDVVEKSVKKGLQGIECLSGIPGSTGAAPIQNIGAYGQELSDVFVSLKAYDIDDDELVTFTNKDCEFGYRESVFKRPKNRGKYLILQVTLRLHKNKSPNLTYDSLIHHLESKDIKDEPTLSDIRQAVLELRGVKLEDPELIGNAGSFFKNPIISTNELNEIKEKHPDIPSFRLGSDKHKVFAGWLIDKAGWRGRSVGKAKVSEKNALVLTNPGGASAKDIRGLAKNIQDDIRKKYGIELEPEVNIL